MSDPNEFGEKLREWAFVGNFLGCYGTFTLNSSFKEYGGEWLYSQHPNVYIEFAPGANLGHLPKVFAFYDKLNDITIAWWWEDFGVLLIGERGVWAINRGCRHTNNWEWLNEKTV